MSETGLVLGPFRLCIYGLTLSKRVFSAASALALRVSLSPRNRQSHALGARTGRGRETDAQWNPCSHQHQRLR